MPIADLNKMTPQELKQQFTEQFALRVLECGDPATAGPLLKSSPRDESDWRTRTRPRNLKISDQQS
jgi:hypothetical protein